MSIDEYCSSLDDSEVWVFFFKIVLSFLTPKIISDTTSKSKRMLDVSSCMNERLGRDAAIIGAISTNMSLLNEEHRLTCTCESECNRESSRSSSDDDSMKHFLHSNNKVIARQTMKDTLHITPSRGLRVG